MLTAQGVPFIRAGEEMMQDKQGEPNSFRSPDAVNRIDWALKAKNRDLFDYVRGLIALRKAHPAFRIPTAEGLQQGLHFLDTGDSGVIAYTLADWTVVCRDGRIDPGSRDRMPGGIVRIAPSSAIIAYRE